MREATLGGLSALDTIRPGKSAAQPRKPAGTVGRRPQKNSGRFRRLRTRFALIVGSAGFSALMIGIVLNATVMQKEHHPAPLFGGAAPPAPVRAATPVPPPAAPETAASLPLPVVDPPVSPAPTPAVGPVDRSAGAQASKASSHAVVHATAPAPPVAKAHASARSALAHHADPIGQLINRSGGADLHDRTAHATIRKPGTAPGKGSGQAKGSAQGRAAMPKPSQAGTAASVPHRTIPIATGVATTSTGVN